MLAIPTLIALAFFTPSFLCEQWFIDVDNNPATGYPISGIGAEVIVDVYGDVRSVYGGTSPNGWGGVIPAIVQQGGPYAARIESYSCDVGCVSCEVTGIASTSVSYSCAGNPAGSWPDTDKGDLRHIAQWMRCW